MINNKEVIESNDGVINPFYICNVRIYFSKCKIKMVKPRLPTIIKLINLINCTIIIGLIKLKINI